MGLPLDSEGRYSTSFFTDSAFAERRLQTAAVAFARSV
jgi:hypothetical protein